MTLELKKLLDEINRKDKYLYFLYNKLYYNPTTIYNDEMLKYYIKDEYFFDFLNVAYSDDTFYKKLDYDTINKIHKVLYDMFNNYDDKTKINKIIKRTETIIKCIFKENIESKNKRDQLFSLIESDDYNSTDYYLNRYVYIPDDIIDALTCNNNFLDLIENKIINGNIDKITIDNIINIIYRSIEFKIYYFNKDSKNFKIPTEDIMSFDIKRAKEIISKLNNLRNHTKITYFNKYIVKNT